MPGHFVTSGAGAVSVVTLGELRAGVLRARTETTRAERRQRLAVVRRAYEPIPVDEEVADRYGRALAHARERGRIEDAADLLILATAWRTERRLLTRDVPLARLAASLAVPVEIVG